MNTNRYLVKIAKAKKEESTSYEERLQPQQNRVLARLAENGGIVANHSMGSGKTLLALAAIHRAQKAHPNDVAYFISPAPLVNNFDKEVEKHKIPIDKSRVKVMSYDKAIRRREELLADNPSIVVLDEAQKVRNTNTARFQNIEDIAQQAKQRLLLTGTSAYNKPHDIAPLVNIAAGNKVLPTDPKKFEAEFLAQRKVDPGFLNRLMGMKAGHETVIRKESRLGDTLRKYVDVHDAKKVNPHDFPTVSEKIVPVEMSKSQHRVYKFLEGDMPFLLRAKIRAGLPLDKKEAENLNAFATGVRQASNDHRIYTLNSEGDSPKIKAAVDSLEKSYKEDKNFRGVVYSNFLDAGVTGISAELRKRKIPHATYTGGINDKQRKALVDDYNNGKNPVLIISSSGGEGLDLKGTKKLQVLEPHFNKSKIDQVVGRGARYQSHHHLPENERHMEVEHYQSVFPAGWFGASKAKSIDQYLHMSSEDKDKVHKEMIGMAAG